MFLATNKLYDKNSRIQPPWLLLFIVTLCYVHDQFIQHRFLLSFQVWWCTGQKTTVFTVFVDFLWQVISFGCPNLRTFIHIPNKPSRGQDLYWQWADEKLLLVYGELIEYWFFYITYLKLETGFNFWSMINAFIPFLMNNVVYPNYSITFDNYRFHHNIART